MAITGGTGGLGLLAAAWAASTGTAGSLRLISRSGRAPTEPTRDGAGSHQPELSAWPYLTCSSVLVEVVAADVSFAEDAMLVWEGCVDWRGVDVVLQASGVLADGMLSKQTIGHLRR